jgi:hypothetical protein
VEGGGLIVSGVSRNRGRFVKFVAIQKRLGIPGLDCSTHVVICILVTYSTHLTNYLKETAVFFFNFGTPFVLHGKVLTHSKWHFKKILLNCTFFFSFESGTRFYWFTLKFLYTSICYCEIFSHNCIWHFGRGWIMAAGILGLPRWRVKVLYVKIHHGRSSEFSY